MVRRGALGRLRNQWTAKSWWRRGAFLSLVMGAALVAGWFASLWWNQWPARVVLRGSARLTPLAFSPDHTTLATVGPDGISLRATSDGRKRVSWPVTDNRWPFLGQFSPDGRTLVVQVHDYGPETRSVDLIDTDSGRRRATIPLGKSYCLSLSIDSDSRVVRAITRDQQKKSQVIEHDLEDGSLRSSHAISSPFLYRPNGVSSDGRLLLLFPDTASSAKRPSDDLIVWDAEHDREAGHLVNLLNGPLVMSVGISADGTLVGVGRNDGSIELWDTRIGRLRTRLRGHSAGYDSSVLVFSPDGSTLASMGRFIRPALSAQGIRFELARNFGFQTSELPVELIVFDLRNGSLLRKVAWEGRAIYSPDGRMLVTVDRDGAVLLRDVPETR